MIRDPQVSVFAEIHEPASRGRSGVRYAASMGCHPDHTRAMFRGPVIVFSFASMKRMRQL
jgi:hypothetical protein